MPQPAEKVALELARAPRLLPEPGLLLQQGFDLGPLGGQVTGQGAGPAAHPEDARQAEDQPDHDKRGGGHQEGLAQQLHGVLRVELDADRCEGDKVVVRREAHHDHALRLTAVAGDVADRGAQHHAVG